MITPNGTLFGFYRALVVSAEDPDKQGRVRVRIPDIMVDKGWGTGIWCDNGIWARPANNWIGGRNTYDTKGPRCNHTDAWYQGSCMIPPKGSHVFVFFEKGDPSHPFYFAAADYGQTKVLPENRVGPQWWKKWTPIKTREGRTFVMSDDPFDARVELTGKKRAIHNTPDGDTETVFNIDGNQSVFLIDERPGHEKIFLKDYRGNYIKMIQDEEGINDQLHVFFKDDIHLETLKNIYIQAHENIHITANKNIYITALENMHIKVIKEFREMAHLINRYSETNDNRMAEIDINDNANNDCARNAANIVRDMGGSMVSRDSGGTIADASGGGFSLQSGGTMSILGGGGTMIDGPTVTIENGSAPIAPAKGITPATMAVPATLPTPDPSRHFEPSDDGWNPSAPDENPQYKCHNAFWKPHYNWSSISQCDSASVNIGGGGGSASVPPPEGSNTPGSSNTPTPSNSQQNNTQPNIPSKPPASIAKTIDKVLDETKDEVSKSPDEIMDSAAEKAEGEKDKLVNKAANVSEKVKDVANDIKTAVDDLSSVTIKNNTIQLLDDISKDKCDEISSDAIKSNPIEIDIASELNDIKTEIQNQIGSETNPSVIREKVSQILNNHKESIGNSISNQSSQSVKNNLSNISDSVKNSFNNYDNLTNKALQNNKDSFTNNSKEQIEANISDMLETSGIEGQIQSDSLNNNLNTAYNQYTEEYVDTIDPSDPIFDETQQNITNEINNNVDTFVKETTSNSINNAVENINNDLDTIISIVQSDPTKDVAQLVCASTENRLNEQVSNVKNSINNDFVKATICSGTQEIDSQIDAAFDPLNKMNQKFETEVAKDLNTDIQNGLIDIYSNDDSEEEDEPTDQHNTSLPGMTEIIRKTVVDAIPTTDDVMNYVLDKAGSSINTFVNESTSVLRPVEDITSDVIICVGSGVKSTKIIINKAINIADYALDYGFMCAWDRTTRFEDYIFDSLGDVADAVASNIAPIVSDGVNKAIHIPSVESNISNFLNNINYRVTKGYLNTIFLGDKITGGISNNIDLYFENSTVNDLQKLNSCYNDFVDGISSFDVTSKLKNDIDYNPTDDLNHIISTSIIDLRSELNDCTGIPVIPNTLKESFYDILNPIYNLSNYSDVLRANLDSDIGIPLDQQFNPLIPTICGGLQDTIYSAVRLGVVNDVMAHVGSCVESLKHLCTIKLPVDWTMEELQLANSYMACINDYYNNFTDIVAYSDSIGMVDLITNRIMDDILYSYPTQDGYKQQLLNGIRDACGILCAYIADLCKKTILLTENIENNEFYKDLDLTKIYTIPGVKSSKFKCIPTADDPESMWCDPEVIGGCGCWYEYSLFLKHKFYQTMIPILVNDSIKTVAISLNPIIDKLSDIEVTGGDLFFHDRDIINDYIDLVNKIFNKEECDLENNKYLNRIDEFMTTCDAFDLTCVVNLMDFSYQGYRWLKDIRDMDKYTHDMVDECLITFLTLIVKKVYFKNDGTRRSSRIILNLGYKSFTNPADPENEKYNIYPNCGFIREMIMKLINNCNISTNYMSITANENNNLYYYNPYTEFKNYDDNVQHVLEDYEICLIDYVDDCVNGNADVITYDDENNISSGYANFFTKCNEKSYPFSYMNDLIEWCTKRIGNKTIIEIYKMDDGEIDANIMNVIFSPNARKVMRYFYKGHEKYFNYKDLKFDPHTGDVIEE